MFSRLNRTALILAATGWFSGAPAQTIEEPPLRLCWEDTEKPPYLALDKGQPPRGISVELVSAVIKRAGLSVQPVVWPWKRCLAEISAGSIDLVPNASFTTERTQFALYSKPLYRTHMAFFYDTRRFATPPKIASLDDLKAYRVGGVHGFNYTHLKDLPMDTGARSREILLRKLEAGRIDLANEQLEVMQAAMRELGLPASRIAYLRDPFIAAKEFHILISKKNAQAEALRQRIDAAILSLERDGTQARINARATPAKTP